MGLSIFRSLMPVCLPATSSHYYAGNVGMVLGLGQFRHDQFPESPIIVNVTLHSDQDCQQTTWSDFNSRYPQEKC